MSSPIPFIPASTEDSSPNHTSMSRSGSYFFGFLIAFAVVLVLFVGCGLVSRHRALARRRRRGPGAIGVGDTWVFRLWDGLEGPEPCEPIQPHNKPVWIERWVEGKSERVQSGEREEWKAITPLSVTMIPLHNDHNQVTDIESVEKPRRASLSTLSSWFSGFTKDGQTNSETTEHADVSETPSENLSAGVEAHITVMVAMPSEPNRSVQVYEFGVARVPVVTEGSGVRQQVNGTS